MKMARGFTLLEILVAVALLAMMGLILTTATGSILGAIKDTREAQEQYHAARVALGRMEREIAMAYVSKHQSQFKTTKTAFIGKGNALTFSYMGHRPMTRNAHESDEGFVTYKLEKDRATGQNVLVRREKPVIDDAPEKGGQRLVLATGVTKLTFQYWDFDKESWQSDWKVEIDNAREAELKKSMAATAITNATGNAELGKAMVGNATQDVRHGPEELWLPARVKISMTLETEDTSLSFETQTRVRLMQPIEFGGISTPKPYENTLNPYAAIPAQTPSNFNTLPKP
jgi:general secretion pathway protein J